MADQALYWDMICESAEQRLKVLQFWERHGLGEAQLHAERVRQRPGRGTVNHSLSPDRRARGELRRREWPQALIEKIRRLRTEHPNLGKEKLHRRWSASAQGMRWPCRACARSAGSLPRPPIKCATRSCASRAFTKGEGGITVSASPRAIGLSARATASPGNIERRLHGLKRHLITCTDLASRFGFALGVKYLSSQQACRAWQLYQLLFPAPVRRVLSDNGKQFARYFHSALKASGVEHWHTFPRTPKMNAYCERFNRTVQDEFLDVHEELLFYDLPQFNQRLLDWIAWFNTERPHHSLQLHTPLDILARDIGTQCRKYWPNTLA